MKWKDKLLNDLYDQLKDDNEWSDIIHDTFDKHKFSIHLAIFTEPFMSLLFTGAKTIESRLSNNNIVPFGKIKIGDIVLIKRSAGTIEGAFIAADVKSVHGSANIRKCLSNKDYLEMICLNADQNFSESKYSAQYATFITISNLKKLKPINIEKSDRTGWVLIKQGFNQTLFNELYG